MNGTVFADGVICVSYGHAAEFLGHLMEIAHVCKALEIVRIALNTKLGFVEFLRGILAEK